MRKRERERVENGETFFIKKKKTLIGNSTVYNRERGRETKLDHENLEAKSIDRPY